MPHELRKCRRGCSAGMLAAALAFSSFAAVRGQGSGEISKAPEQIAAPPAEQQAVRFDQTDFNFAIPSDWQPWWRGTAKQPLLDRPARVNLDVDAVVLGSLMHSAQIKVLRDVPAIRRTSVAEAHAQFDVQSFVESKLTDTSDPVGSTLTTGGPPRYLDQNWFSSAGVRQLSPTGTRLEAAQKLGYEDSNSVFFVPNQQGTTRLSLSLTQPLLNGAGQMYNTSTMVLAQIDTKIAQDQYARDLQNVVLEVHKAYWNLHLERVILLQKRKLLYQGRQIYDDLNARREVDVVRSQLARAKGAVATRAAAVIRQEAAVLNAEARLRTLVNDPVLGTFEQQELVPVQPPIAALQSVGLQDSLVMALANRPEIDQATRELRAARVRLNVSDHELMPVLNLILSSYVSGLEGNSAIFRAFGDQFSTGRPTYSAGVLLQYPFGNRAAQARLKRRRLEMRQLTNQLEVTTNNIRLEVETAVREIATAHRETISHYHAILGGEAEIEHLEQRWRMLPGDQPSAGIVLDDLLNAQERLGRAEASYADTLVAYNLALVQLKRATGVLLQVHSLDATGQLSKTGSPIPAATRPAATATPNVAGPQSVADSTPQTISAARHPSPNRENEPRSALPAVRWPGLTAAAAPRRPSRADASQQQTPPTATVWPPLPDIAPADSDAPVAPIRSGPPAHAQAMPLPSDDGPQLLPPVTDP